MCPLRCTHAVGIKLAESLTPNLFHTERAYNMGVCANRKDRESADQQASNLLSQASPEPHIARYLINPCFL